MADPNRDAVQEELRLAAEALNDAQVLLAGDGSDAGILNRLYYAAFHAAQAVLYDRGLDPSSHGQVRQLFGQHVVRTGTASRAEGRLLGTVYDYRWEADYGGGQVSADVGAILTEVDSFLEMARTLIDDSGPA